MATRSLLDCFIFGKNLFPVSVWVIICCFSFCLPNHGMNQALNLAFERIKPKDGLNNRYIDFIKKDSRGFIWMSSMEGIYRYDGLEIKQYTPENTITEEGKGLLGKNIQSNFFEDSSGNIWFTPINGINCYHRRTDTFLNFHLKDEEGENIEEGYHLFHLEQDSILWLKASSCIYRYNIHKGNQEKIVETRGFRFAVDTLPDGAVRSVYACPWIMGSGIERITFTSDRRIVKQFFFENGFPSQEDKTLNVSKVIVENDSLVWLFSEQQGLISLNPQNGNHKEPYRLPSGTDTHVKDGAILDERFLFVTSKNQGLWLFDRKKETFAEQYSFDENNPQGIGSNDLREIFLDNHQHLWLSFHDKAEIDQSWLYRNPFFNPFFSLKERFPEVKAMVEDKLNHIWCATQQQGIFVFKQDGTLLEHFPYASENRFSGLPPIRHLSISDEEVLWALGDQDIFQYLQGRWRRVFHAGDEKLFQLSHISAIRKAVSSSEGLFVLRVDSLQWKSWIERRMGGSEDYQVFNGLSSRDGRTHYLSNKAGELAVLKYDQGKVRQDTLIDVGADVYVIFEEGEGILALGTSKGAYLLNLEKQQMVNLFPNHELLKSTQVYSIAKDGRKRYWLSTNIGIWVYAPQLNELYQFRPEDGLPSQEFSLYAHLKASDGKIWMGTTNGVVVFHPDSIRPYPCGPQVQIKSFKVNRDSFALGEHIGEVKSLDLNYRQNTLEFEVVGITHYLPHFNILHYKLEEYDKEWKSIENGGRIQFTKVPPGSYTLRIYGTNANGLKGEPKNLDINISPPFWKTPEFIILSIIALVALVYLLFRFMLSRRLRKQELAFQRREELREALQEERNRIAGEMHEDLGGGLTAIQLIIQKIRKKGLQAAPEQLQKIENNAGELVENMKEIIWAMNSSYDNLPDLVAYLRRYLVEYLDDIGIECAAHTPDHIPDLIINGKKRRNIFLCVKESAHNIVKHAEASQVRLTILCAEDLEIEIKDNGRGIPPGQDNRFGNGLKNMNMRMEQIRGTLTIENDNGVRIKMKVPLENETQELLTSKND